MVYERTSNAKAVSEMHAGHGSQGIDIPPRHPHRLCIVAVDCVQEAVLLRQKARRHYWAEDESQERHEVGQRHRPSNDCKGGVRRRDVVVPSDKAGSAWHMYQTVCAIHDAQGGGMATESEPALNFYLRDREQPPGTAELLQFQNGKSVFLRHVPYAGVFIQLIGQIPGSAIKCPGDYPVEHFDQEWEALENPRMHIILISGRVWSVDSPETEARSRLWRPGFGGKGGLPAIVIVAVEFKRGYMRGKLLSRLVEA